MTEVKRSPTLHRFGIGMLGFIGGLLAGLIIQNLLAVAFMSNGNPPFMFALVLGYLVPVFAALGVVIALLTDTRWTKRHSNDAPDA
jgi:hypothetical protein